MIQDIEPQNFANEFENSVIENNDVVFVFRKREILIRQKEDGKLEIPSYAEIKKKENLKKEDFQYIFSIDHVKYYLLKKYDEEVVYQAEGYCYQNISLFRSNFSKDICFGIMNAFHLFVWYKDNQFCGRCGHKTVHDEKQRMLMCPECGNMIYPKIAPAVIVGLVHNDKILMSKYADREYKKYALLAGFVEFGETAEKTVQREVMEEVGLHVKNIKYYKSQPWGVDSNLLLGYFAELDGDETVSVDLEELELAEWFEREKMPAHDDGISLTREMMGFFENEEKFNKWFIKD